MPTTEEQRQMIQRAIDYMVDSAPDTIIALRELNAVTKTVTKQFIAIINKLNEEENDAESAKANDQAEEETG